jgi:hypothetical protein
MTSKEKAFELVAKYSRVLPMNQTTLLDHKNCALIAVDEIIKAHIHNEGVRHLKWWQEVKQEIENLQTT